MSWFLPKAVSSLTMVGYLLVITWGPLWHDHRHCHSHSQDGEAGCCTAPVIEHPHCCSHHHSNCGEESQEPSVDGSQSSPCHSPLHDEDCPVCRVLAHKPLAAPAIVVVEVSVPVLGFVLASAPLAERIASAVYDSRGPPLV